MAEKNKEIASRVIGLLNEASDYVGRYEAESFSQDRYCELLELGMDSPLEHAMHIAFETVARINFVQFAEPISSNEMSTGLIITPQRKIGPYRADFSVEWLCYIGGKVGVFREVVVECDGTAFHERTEKERRYEKHRDRYMQKLGLKVFRYTGKEILDDPYKIAAEVIGYVTDDEKNTFTPSQYFE